MEYKRPTGKYFVHYFHKICSICISFQDALAVKISLDLLKGLWSYGVLIWRGLVTPKFSVPLAAKLCVRHPNILEVQERARGPLSPCQVWWRSDFTRRRDGKKRWVFCLSVTLFHCPSRFFRPSRLFCPSRFWTSLIVRPISPWRRWSTEMILMSLQTFLPSNPGGSQEHIF